MSKMIQNHVEEERPSIDKAFTKFIWNRIEALDNAPESEEKQKARAAILEAYQKLKELLTPKDYKEIVLEVLDPCAGTVGTCDIEEAYKLGIKDGLALQEILNP